MNSAGEFPSNMMVAKPYRGGRSGEVYYFTGMVYEAMGRKKMAWEQYQLCVEERLNSRLDETHFYKALGLEKLGKTEEAEEIFEGLISLGQQQLHYTQADFFAKFGERETPDDKLSNAYYLIGLGHLGKKMDNEARLHFSEAVRLNINHVWAAEYLSQLKK
jgi:tetratricopeptide (TPR) repeat protein